MVGHYRMVSDGKSCVGHLLFETVLNATQAYRFVYVAEFVAFEAGFYRGVFNVVKWR